MTDLPLDDAWLAEPSRRSRLRRVLVAVLVAALVFLGGVTAQQRWGSTATAAVAGPGAGGMPAMGAMGAARAGASSTTSDTTAAAPAVIGTVTTAQGTTWTVTDLGGTAHQVTVPDGVEVAAGTTVSITGDADDSGAVAATAVTIRSTQN